MYVQKLEDVEKYMSKFQKMDAVCCKRRRKRKEYCSIEPISSPNPLAYRLRFCHGRFGYLLFHTSKGLKPCLNRITTRIKDILHLVGGFIKQGMPTEEGISRAQKTGTERFDTLGRTQGRLALGCSSEANTIEQRVIYDI